MKKILLILTFVLLWAGWFFCFRYHIIWLEGFTFFSTLPDYTDIHLDMPKDIFRYIGAFLLQFYAMPAVGAAIQAILLVILILCVDGILNRMSDDNDNLIWMAYIPMPVFLYYQMIDISLTMAVQIVLISAVCLLVAYVATIKGRPFRSMPRLFHNKYVALVLLVSSFAVSGYVFTNNKSMNHQHESLAYLEYLSKNKRWDDILETVSVQDALSLEYKRKYTLLALSETGRLTDFAFRYGLSSSEDFVYNKPKGPFECNFNVFFYSAMGMNNPVVHNASERALQSWPGLTFDTVRVLADVYLDQKDYVMAKKYIDILSHTTCHGKWVRERLPKLEAIKDVEPEYRATGDPFSMDYFLRDLSSMVERYKHEDKYADYLMCALLADKDGNKFFQVFSIIYPRLYADGKIPRLYQEALLLIASKEPEILQMYRIDEDVWKRFADFTDMMRNGKVVQAKRKYAGTYWAYVY